MVAYYLATSGVFLHYLNTPPTPENKLCRCKYISIALNKFCIPFTVLHIAACDTGHSRRKNPQSSPYPSNLQSLLLAKPSLCPTTPHSAPQPLTLPKQPLTLSQNPHLARTTLHPAPQLLTPLPQSLTLPHNPSPCPTTSHSAPTTPHSAPYNP